MRLKLLYIYMHIYITIHMYIYMYLCLYINIAFFFYYYNKNYLDRLSTRTPCLVSVSLESILMLNSLSTRRTKEMAPESGFMYSKQESFTTNQLKQHKYHRPMSSLHPVTVINFILHLSLLCSFSTFLK